MSLLDAQNRRTPTGVLLPPVGVHDPLAIVVRSFRYRMFARC